MSLALLDKIDTIINKALEQDDPMIAFYQIQELERAKELIENSKGKFMYELSRVWDQFSISAHESLYTQTEVNLGWHPYTVDQYITMWKYQDQLPESLQEKPIREKRIITKALSQGHTFSNDDWDALENASGDSEIRAIVRGVKGTEPRKNAVVPYLYDDGSLIVYCNDERINAGFLDVNNNSDGVKKFIQRVIDNCGVIRK